MSVKDEFIDIVAQNCRNIGLDELSSKIIGILYVEPNELSLEELSNRTGYSLSSISTNMKLIERIGLVNRSHKPGSKKVYFFMEKDLLKVMIEMQRKKYELNVKPTKDKLPHIIEKYKKDKGDRKELEIAECYYEQVLRMEKLMLRMSEFLKEEV